MSTLPGTRHVRRASLSTCNRLPNFRSVLRLAVYAFLLDEPAFAAFHHDHRFRARYVCCARAVLLLENDHCPVGLLQTHYR